MGAGDTIRALVSDQPFIMAPMAGVTDAAYRTMMRAHGARLAYSEMVSVAGLAYASERTWELVLPAPCEPSIAVQLFGSKPDQFGSAVEAVEERVGERLALIDINMACPARKVVTKGEGSALMNDPDLAAEIMRSAVSAAHVPVTAKIRMGFASGERTAPEFARVLEDAGAAGIAVHGRTARQLYTGRADWSVINEVARCVSVPVIGSGDVFSARDACRMLDETAATAAFIARGTYGNPWIFDDALAFFERGVEPPEHGPRERLGALREHLALTRDLVPRAIARARTYATWYLKGIPHAAHWRGRVVRCTGYEAFCSLVDEIEADLAACERAAAEGAPLPEPPSTGEGA